MKTYIVISSFTEYISGGPIYHRNKLKYLEERGWRTLALSVDPGKTYISGMEKYTDASFAFVRKQPNEFPRKQRERLLNKFVSYIGEPGEVCIIETGTDFTAYWGEALAERLKAKHVVFLLDEKNKNITLKHMPFYDFKLRRKEFARINAELTKEMFSSYRPISDAEAYSIKAYCDNSVEDVKYSTLKEIHRKDYNIGSVGRLEKVFVPIIIDGILEFAKTVPDKQILVMFIGGAQPEVVDQIERRFKEADNIELRISGYICPIPKSLVKKMDVFFSGSGSALVSAKLGIPTVAMDILTGQPIGFVRDTSKVLFFNESQQQKSVYDFLADVFLYKKYDVCEEVDLENEWGIICEEFDRQMNFIENSANQKVYFPMNKLPLNSPQRIRKGLRFILGENLYKVITSSEY